MQNRSFFNALCGAIGILAALPVPAATTDDTPIDTVTIIGQRQTPADVAGSAHVVDAEELRVFLASDVLRVLRTVPGVYLQEEEGFGLRPNIGIRGSGLDRSARIALLEDGVLIAPAPYSAPSAYYFPTQRRMHALEVLKGPAAIAVGPRTTGGALNLVSTPIPDGFAANLDTRFGEFGIADAHLYVGDRGDRFSWLAETVQSQSDGFKHIDGPETSDTGYRLEDYVVKLQYDNHPRSAVYQSIRVKLGYTDQSADETYLGLTAADFASDPLERYAASAGDVFTSEHEQYQLSYVIEADRRWRGEVTVYRNEFARNWYKLQSVIGVGLASVLDDPVTHAIELGYLKGDSSPADAISKRANKRSYYSQGLQAQIARDFDVGGAELALTVGVRLHEDEEDRFQHEDTYRMNDGVLALTTAAAPGSKTNRVSNADARSLFVNAAFTTDRWTLTPGFRYEDIDMRRLDFSTADPARSAGPVRVRSNSASVFIPGIGALYRVNPNLRLLAGIHRGFNPPAPGSTVDAETSVNVEAGLRYTAGSLTLESILFHNDYGNLVGTVTNSTGGGGEIGDQFDGGEAVVNGLELSAEYSRRLGEFDVPLSLQYTWTAKAEFENAFASSFDPWGVVEVGDELPYIPEHQLRASAGLERAKWRVNLAANYLGRVRTRASQGPFDPASSIDSRIVWDVAAAWRVTPDFSTYLKVDNLLDETYVAARRPAGLRPGLPRTAYFGFIYRL